MLASATIKKNGLIFSLIYPFILLLLHYLFYSQLSPYLSPYLSVSLLFSRQKEIARKKKIIKAIDFLCTPINSLFHFKVIFYFWRGSTPFATPPPAKLRLGGGIENKAPRWKKARLWEQKRLSK